MTLFRPELLLLVPLVPLLMAGAAWLYVRRRRRVAAALGERPLVGRIVGADLHAVPWPRVLLACAAALALGIAAADPRWGEAAERAERALDLVLVLDASNSMLARDAPPNRLEQQREAARRLVRALAGDRIGLVIFAGRAYILAPPTPDRGALELYLDALGPEMVEQTGSSLAAALRQGTNLVAGSEGADAGRVLVLVSDGEAHEEEQQVLAEARRAAAARVTVYTLGIGTPQGARVPEVDPSTGEERGFKLDPLTGLPAVTRLEEGLLRQIARLTGGVYAPLAQPGALEDLLAHLARAERGRSPAQQRQARAPQYAWFVALALLCLTVDAVRERRRGGSGEGAE